MAGTSNMRGGLQIATIRPDWRRKAIPQTPLNWATVKELLSQIGLPEKQIEGARAAFYNAHVKPHFDPEDEPHVRGEWDRLTLPSTVSAPAPRQVAGDGLGLSLVRDEAQRDPPPNILNYGGLPGSTAHGADDSRINLNGPETRIKNLYNGPLPPDLIEEKGGADPYQVYPKWFQL